MGGQDRRVERGRHRGRRQRAELGAQLRLARLSRGLSQSRVAQLLGVSQMYVSRLERGAVRVDLELVAAYAAVVGLDLVVNLYPGGSGLRDAGHARLLTRLSQLLRPMWTTETESPIPIPGDQRGIDMVGWRDGVRLGFELEMRLLDTQAVARRCALKQRDARLTQMFLVLSDTPSNRAAVAAGGGALRGQFPLESRQILKALRHGVDPGANGVLFL